MSAAQELSRSIVIDPRHEHFPFKTSKRRDWLDGDTVRTVIFNAFSITFPEGEKFFMDSVKHFRDQIDDPVLLKQIEGFLVQEALHSREHIGYNRELDAQGFSASKINAVLRDRFVMARDKLTPHRRLAATCALEHFTAMLASQLMQNPHILDGADAPYKSVWLWHALEEAEHKGVAFDTYLAVTPEKIRYRLRCWAMIMTTIMFFIIIGSVIKALLKDIGLSRSPKAWWQCFKFFWISPGFFRKMTGAWLAYFKPSYHPWSHDDRELMKKTEHYLSGLMANMDDGAATETGEGGAEAALPA